MKIAQLASPQWFLIHGWVDSLSPWLAFRPCDGFLRTWLTCIVRKGKIGMGISLLGGHKKYFLRRSESRACGQVRYLPTMKWRKNKTKWISHPNFPDNGERLTLISSLPYTKPRFYKHAQSAVNFNEVIFLLQKLSHVWLCVIISKSIWSNFGSSKHFQCDVTSFELS